MKRAWTIVGCLVGSLALAACQTTAPDASAATAAAAPQAPPARCAEGHFRDFDFWLGTWDVFNLANEQLAGRNVISPRERGCLLQENWTGQGGGTGMSINYYTPNTGQWRQVWVANGYNIDIKGGLNDAGAMVLEGEIYYFNQTGGIPFRGVWTPMPDGWVRQTFHQYNAETEQWDLWFDGKYVKVEE